MDQVCLCKNSTAGRDTGDFITVGVGNIAELLNPAEIKPLRLLVQEAPGTCGAGTVGAIIQVLPMDIKTDQTKFFPAHNEDRADPVMAPHCSSNNAYA